MIESGLSLLVQANSAVLAICPVGGFLTQLPKDQVLPSWSYMIISDHPNYVFEGESALSSRRFQIDCYGNTGEDTINLAKAIDAVLNGFRGLLPDTDSTIVPGCFRTGTQDFFDEARRSYRRMLEYLIYSYR